MFNVLTKHLCFYLDGFVSVLQWCIMLIISNCIWNSTVHLLWQFLVFLVPLVLFFFEFLQQYSEGVIMAQWVGRWTYVQEVAGSTHGHDVAV